MFSREAGPPPEPMPSWQAEVADLLARAASLSAREGVELDVFMRSAWAAFMDARPGLREHLEEMQLRSQLDELRKAGRVAQA